MFSFLSLSCKKSNKKIQTISGNKDFLIQKDSLQKIKDTTLFINSSEGEEVRLSVNIVTRDSIIESEVLGEMGKSDYKFVFNKTLKTGDCKTFRYLEPIYINSNPKISSEKKENLSTSKEASKRLNDLFRSYKNILIKSKKNSNQSFNNKWFGKYKLTLNNNSEDWRNIHEIELNISKDSVTYLAKGFQLYQYYKLSATGINNNLKLTYNKSLDNTDSWALQKTKDFGTITFNGDIYIWVSPYIDVNFNNEKKYTYILERK